MMNFKWEIGIYSVEEVLKRFLIVDVRNINELLHFLLKLVAEKSVMNSDNSSDANILQLIMSHILLLKS